MNVVTPEGHHHCHCCEDCGEIWWHTKEQVTPEERRRRHLCPKCGAGPYIMAYDSLRVALETQRHVRAVATAEGAP